MCGKEIDKEDARIKAKIREPDSYVNYDFEELFEQCCDGEYPTYTITAKGREYAEGLRGERMIDDGEDD